jgi:hypothetical protein
MSPLGDAGWLRVRPSIHLSIHHPTKPMQSDKHVVEQLLGSSPSPMSPLDGLACDAAVALLFLSLCVTGHEFPGPVGAVVLGAVPPVAHAARDDWFLRRALRPAAAAQDRLHHAHGRARPCGQGASVCLSVCLSVYASTGKHDDKAGAGQCEIKERREALPGHK